MDGKQTKVHRPKEQEKLAAHKSLYHVIPDG